MKMWAYLFLSVRVLGVVFVEMFVVRILYIYGGFESFLWVICVYRSCWIVLLARGFRGGGYVVGEVRVLS